MQMLYNHEFYLNFQGHKFENRLHLWNCENPHKNASNNFYRSKYWPLNGIITNVVLHDLHLNFQGKKIEMLISETMRAIAKMRHMTFTEVYICHWMAYCICCTRWPWPSFLRSNFFCYAFAIKNCSNSGCPSRVSLTRTTSAVELLFLNLILSPSNSNETLFRSIVCRHLFLVGEDSIRKMVSYLLDIWF